MSAIAHWLEQQAITTVVIGLVRLHLEKVRPPRALWVPFELGRPMGPPQRPDFQRQVLREALALIERDDGPGLITDYAQDDPNALDDPDWKTPALDQVKCVYDELQSLKPAHDQAMSRYGRSAVGVANMDIEQAARCVDSYIDGQPLSGLRDDISQTMTLRLALDDVRAYYTEAAARFGEPSSRQIGEWFWFSTVAGNKISALKASMAAGDDAKLKTLADKFIVPRAFERAT